MAATLRPATPDDLPAIAAIYADSVLNGVATYELEPPSLEEMAARFGAVTGKGYPWLVAEDPDRVIGYAYAGPYRPRPAYRWMVEDSIYLDPAARGQGVGRAILERLLDDCTRLGFRQMVAVIGGRSEASIAVHASMGFHMIGHMPATGFKFGRWLDTTIMQRPLGEGAETLPDPAVYPGTLA